MDVHGCLALVQVLLPESLALEGEAGMQLQQVITSCFKANPEQQSWRPQVLAEHRCMPWQTWASLFACRQICFVRSVRRESHEKPCTHSLIK